MPADPPSDDHLLTDAVAELLRVGTERVRQLVDEGKLVPAHVARGTSGRVQYLFHRAKDCCTGKGTAVYDVVDGLHELYLLHEAEGIPVPPWLRRWQEPPFWRERQQPLPFKPYRPLWLSGGR